MGSAPTVLAQQFGCDLVQLHAAAVHLVNIFAFSGEAMKKGKLPCHLVDTAKLREPNNALGDLREKLANLLIATPTGTPPDIERVLGPKSVLPLSLRTRPFYHWTDNPGILVCWDIRTLHRLLGGRFPEWLAPVFTDDVGAGDALGRAWDLGIESALDALVKPILSTWHSPPKTAQRNQQKHVNCDRCFEEGQDLFMVEIKNVRPGEVLATGSAHHFKNWLRDKFFRKGGFPQIDATLGALAATGKTPFNRRLLRYQRIWPIVVCWTRIPHHPHFTDLLERLRDEHPRRLPDRLSRRIRPPLIMDYDTFLDVVSCIPSLREEGIELGDVFQLFFHLRVDRPFSMATLIHRVVPHAIFPPEMLAVFNKELLSTQQIGVDLKTSRDG